MVEKNDETEEGNGKPDDKTSYFKSYAEFSKTLRTWFIAYGIGAPVLILTNETASNKLQNYPHRKAITWLFLIGVAIQVIHAILNKYSMWCMYYGETNAEFKSNSRWWKVSEWYSNLILFDLVLDIVTGILFSIGTMLIFRALLG